MTFRQKGLGSLVVLSGFALGGCPGGPMPVNFAPTGTWLVTEDNVTLATTYRVATENLSRDVSFAAIGSMAPAPTSETFTYNPATMQLSIGSTNIPLDGNHHGTYNLSAVSTMMLSAGCTMNSRPVVEIQFNDAGTVAQVKVRNEATFVSNTSMTLPCDQFFSAVRTYYNMHAGFPAISIQSTLAQLLAQSVLDVPNLQDLTGWTYQINAHANRTNPAPAAGSDQPSDQVTSLVIDTSRPIAAAQDLANNLIDVYTAATGSRP